MVLLKINDELEQQTPLLEKYIRLAKAHFARALEWFREILQGLATGTACRLHTTSSGSRTAEGLFRTHSADPYTKTAPVLDAVAYTFSLFVEWSFWEHALSRTTFPFVELENRVTAAQHASDFMSWIAIARRCRTKNSIKEGNYAAHSTLSEAVKKDGTTKLSVETVRKHATYFRAMVCAWN